MTAGDSNLRSAKSIYFAALDIEDGKQRSVYLDEVCRGDDELRREVEQLLSAVPAHSGNLLCQVVEKLNPRLENTSADLESLGDATFQSIDIASRPVIDRYKLLEEIGHGGMGSVYMAQQLKPIKRRVALKVINPGMDSREVIARFEAERQALAMMDHQNIARVLDAGTTKEHRPYFVMELVRGKPITEYCQQNRLGLDDRLHLFVDVCQAIQHAHQKGIIHRDIKPSNVMVSNHDGTPVVKVIDFGIAKALHQDLTDKTLFTQFSQMLGTPLYMSPEQAGLSNLDVDTRSDIYSLGVLLYELLTGTTPFDREMLTKAGIDGARRIICEREPMRPSTRFKTFEAAQDSTVITRSPSEAKRLAFKLRSELDWIVMKALEKDRQRRYQTASDFALDVERHLNNDPIKAKPPTPFTRLAKWSRRHAALVWTLLIVSLTLAAVFGISTVAISAARDTAELQREQKEIERKEAVLQRQVAVEQRNAARQNQYDAEIIAGQTQVDRGNPGGLYPNLVNYLPLPGEQDLRGWEWYYLMSKCRAEERTITYPGSKPFAAWSPDGKLIGTPEAIWDADTGKCIRRFSTSFCLRKRVAWSPDSNKFAWGRSSDESAFYIWDRTTNSVSRFAGHDNSVWCLAWSPDGSQIASGAIDKTIKIWDVDTKAIAWSTPTKDLVSSVDWSSTGNLLAFATWSTGMQVWNVQEHKLVSDKPEFATNVCWHPDGTTLAVCGRDRWYLYESEEWKVVSERRCPNCNVVAFSPDGTRFAVAHGDVVTVWDESGESSIAELTGHQFDIVSLSWHADGRRLVSADQREIKLWDLDQLETPPTAGLQENPQQTKSETQIRIQSIDWLDDNKTLVAVDPLESSSVFWLTQDGTLKKREKLVLDAPAAVSEDRRLAAVYNENEHMISIRDAFTGANRSRIKLNPVRRFASATFSRDASKIVVQSEEDTRLHLEIWNVDQERLHWAWENERESGTTPLHLVTWNSNGTRFAAMGFGDPGENGGTYWSDHVHIFDVEKKVRSLKHLPDGSRSGIRSAAWDTDGRMIAIGTTDGRLEVLDAKNGEKVFSRKVHGSGIRAVAWHPLGNRLAVGTFDGAVKIVSSNEGMVILEFAPFRNKVSSLAWSNNGQQLVAVTPRGEIRTWDASRAFELTSGGARRGELAWAYYDRKPQASEETRDNSLREFLRLAPDNLGFWVYRGNVYAELGDFERANEEFSKAVGPELRYSFEAAYRRACALLGSGQEEEYHQFCADLIEAFKDNPIASSRRHVAWLTSLAANPFVDSATVADMAQVSDEEDERSLNQLQLGSALYRNGQFEEVDRLLSTFVDKLGTDGDWTNSCEVACAEYLLSMSRFAMGDMAQSQRRLDEANERAEEFLERAPGRDWKRIVALKALRKEATAKIAE